MDGIANHFPAKNAPHCSFLHIHLTFFQRVIPRTPVCVFGPRHQLPLGLPALSLLLLYETTTDRQLTERDGMWTDMEAIGLSWYQDDDRLRTIVISIDIGSRIRDLAFTTIPVISALKSERPQAGISRQ